MRIGIVGGGVAGLGCAYFLLEGGHQVDVFEQAPEMGGLAGSFDFDGLPVEKYYHFICRDDHDLVALLPQLGLEDEIEWRPGRMEFFYRGELYPFGTPWDLLRFRPLSLISRLRFGLNVAVSRSAKSWARYESVTAKDWLTEQIGEEAYAAIWEPLLRIKFGPYYDQISASWIWHRIHRVARSRSNIFARERLGFLKRGTSVLIARLTAQLVARGAVLSPSTTVSAILTDGVRATGLTVNGADRPYDAIISTAPLPVLARLLPDGAAARIGPIERIQYISVVCLVLKLRRPVSGIL